MIRRLPGCSQNTSRVHSSLTRITNTVSSLSSQLSCGVWVRSPSRELQCHYTCAQNRRLLKATVLSLSITRQFSALSRRCCSCGQAAPPVIITDNRSDKHYHRRRRRGTGGTCPLLSHAPPKKPGKIFFGQLLRKIRAFVWQNSCEIRKCC